MPAHGHFNRPVIILTPSSTANYNVRNACAPSAGTDVIVNVNAGVVISGASRTGTSWPTGCTITINILSGGIWAGQAGDGGAGAANHLSAGSNGGNGINGLFIEDNVKVFVAIYGTGFIAGGGGGAGGGGAGPFHSPIELPGGGGGGGQGYPPGSGGSGYVAGDDGTTSSPGAGGAGDGAAGRGGDGGGLAGVGGPGVSSFTAAGSGGSPGAAIYSVGFPAPVFLAGLDSSHVKGIIKTV